MPRPIRGEPAPFADHFFEQLADGLTVCFLLAVALSNSKS
jgi:hypothetical protein